MYTSIYHGKQRILSASEMSKTKNRELLVQRIFHVIQYRIHLILTSKDTVRPSLEEHTTSL